MLSARRAFCSCALAFAAACVDRAADRNSTLAELERMAFVPAGECVLEARYGPPILCANSEPLLVDRYEVSRGEWLRWYEDDRDAKDPLLAAFIGQWAAETSNWPASFCTLHEARRFARARDMRLLTAREWLRVACGTRGQPWPWGWNQFTSVANTLELDLDRPVPVGTFEQGRTPLATYDMLGNVWEWVEEPIFTPANGSALATWTMGGSFLSHQRRLYELEQDGRLSLFEQELDLNARSSDVGLRCAIEAEQFLRAHARALDPSAATRKRLIAVGALWGRKALPLLEALAAERSAAPAIAAILEGARQ